MKKKQFYTLVRENKKPKAVLVNGYYDERTQLYFYKCDLSKNWNAICIHTGLSIANGRTREECYKNVQSVLNLYRNTMNTPHFNKLVKQYNTAVQIALNCV